MGSKDGEYGRVKGGPSPAKRTLDAESIIPTLDGLRQEKPSAACPRARPAASTAPFWG